MSFRRWGRVARYSSYGTTGLITMVVAAAWILPGFVDSPAVSTEIQRRLSQAVQGEVAWEELSIRILPSPRGVLHKVRVEIPDVAGVSAEEAHAKLRLWPLLRGRAEMVSVSVVRPVIRIDVAPPRVEKRRKTKEPQRDPIEIYRSAVGSVEEAVRAFAVDTVLEIDDASLDIRLSGMAPIQLTQLSLRAQVGPKALDVEMATSSNTWSRLKLSARAEFPDLAGRVGPGTVTDATVIHLSEVRLGSSKLSGGTLRYSPESRAIVGRAVFDLDLAQAIDDTRRLAPETAGAALAAFPVIGRAQGHAKLAFGRSGWSVGVDVLKSDSSVQIPGLPGPVRLTDGSVAIDSKSVSVDHASLAMLDTQARVSATVRDYGTDRLRATAALSEGVVGEKFLAWVWEVAQVPRHPELKTPIRIAAPRVVWGPKQALDLQATARLDAGPAVMVDLSWTPKSLDIRRVSIKDERSDAAIAVRTEGRLLEGKFSGSLNSTSISAVLKSERLPSGAAAGDLRFRYDRERPGRSSAEGNLKGEALDLAWLLRQPVKIDRIDVTADGPTLRIGEASVGWAGQRATIRGEVKRGDSGAVIDAQIDSPGVNVNALLPTEEKTAGEKPLPDKGKASGPWPLPVTGRIAVRSDFVEYGRHRVSPVSATLVLEDQRARLDLKQAQLCGISLPLSMEAKPQGFSFSTRIVAEKQQLEQTAHCLTDQGVRISGVFDLRADLSTQGRPEDLVRNLKGTIKSEVRDGKVMKFALLGNILSMQDISATFRQGGPRLDDTGFPYRKIVVAGRFESGRFTVEQGAFHSDAVALAANGWISLLDYGSRLTVLVAPFGRLDALVRDVPIVGYVIGGALTSVPVGVSGDIRDPLIVPLGPSAITSELTGIFERTLKLPVKLIKSP